MYIGRGSATLKRPPPLVSVVLPVYNAERYLRPAIESVLAQTYRHFELVLVDDGSTDASVAIGEEYVRADSRVRLLRNRCNLGIVQTRNRAFAEADPASAYFAVFDSDDICLPDRLQMQVDFLEAHPDHALVGGHTLVIDEDGGDARRATLSSDPRRDRPRHHSVQPDCAANCDDPPHRARGRRRHTVSSSPAATITICGCAWRHGSRSRTSMPSR